MSNIAEHTESVEQTPRLNLKPVQPPPVRKARMKLRHVGLFFSFLIFVVGSILVAGWYLYTRAEDQYASRVGFTVRSQEVQNPLEIISGLGQGLSGSATSDTDILYEFIQSQQLVDQIDSQLDLRAMYSKPENDPIFAFDPDMPVEDLVDYWRSMVAIYYDSGTGLIELRVRAFAPDDAVAIADAILESSTDLINNLSAEARADATRYAREELATAIDRLTAARQEMAKFRTKEQFVDPSNDVEGQMTVLIELQQLLAQRYIELDLLIKNTRSGDPRVEQTRIEVEVIEKRIETERRKFGLGASDDDATFADKLARFEELSVELEYGQTAYLSAQAQLDTAVREARQQSRYLADYLGPTQPESAEFPQRELLLGLIALFVFLIWSLLTLIYYSLRDRS